MSKRDSRGGRSGLVEGEGTAVLEDGAVREPWKIGLRAQQQQLDAVQGQLTGLAKSMEEVVTATRRHSSRSDQDEQGKGMGSCHKEVCMGRLESPGSSLPPFGCDRQ